MSRPVTVQTFAHVLGILKARERNEFLRRVASSSCRRPVVGAPTCWIAERPRTFTSAAGAAVLERRDEEPVQRRSRPPRPPTIQVQGSGLPLPAELQSILRRQETSSIIPDFILAYDRHHCTPQHLLHAPVILRLSRLWKDAPAETHQWAWLADQVEAGMRVLAETDRVEDQAVKSVLQSTLINALVRTGRLPPALHHIKLMMSAGRLTHSHQYSAVTGYVEACLASGRYADVMGMMGQSGHQLDRLFTLPEATLPSSSVIKKLRSLIMRAYQEAQEPTTWLSMQKEGTEGLHQRQGHILLRALVEAGRLDEALEIHDYLSPVETPLDTVSSIWSALALAGRIDEAHRLYVQHRQHSPKISHVALSRALRMYASRGWEEPTKAIIGEISIRGWTLQDADRRNMINCRAQLGDVEGTLSLAEEFFPSTVISDDNAPQRSSKVSDLHILNLILLAHVNAGRIDDAIPYLTAIMSSPTKPTVETYNTLLKAFVVSGDVEGALGVYDELLDVGLFPTVVTFTSLISLFANIRDPENARHTFALMIEAGIFPDEIAWSALINAHTESGQWTEVSSLWDDLPAPFRSHPSVINSMLKAFVLLGAPFEVVQRFFRSIQATRVPDARAWALVIQSACDCRHMLAARELYDEFDDAARESASTLTANAYIYSILIAGYTRVRDGESAKAVYEEMQRRGIAPTSVTYSMLISSLTRQNSVESTQQARDFAAALLDRIGVDNLGETSKSRGRPLENILSPMILQSTRNYDTASAKTYFDQIAAAGQPSIPAYTLLLDAYGKSGEIKPMLQTWIALFKAATEPPSMRKLFKQRGLSSRPDLARRNVLAIPLSIMIDGLTAAARYADVVKLWTQVKSAGFGFDAHNYNHLAVSLARAGDVESAFRIVDRVLIPRLEQVESRRLTSLRTPEEEDILQQREEEGPVEDGEIIPEISERKSDPALRPPNRRSQGRQDRDYRTTAVGESAIDTEVLRQWRPSDITWRPSQLTIAVLDRAYANLQAPRGVWGAIGEEGEEAEPDIELDAKNVEGESGEGRPIEAGKPIDKQTAWATLVRINRRYGKAVALIRLHRKKRKGQGE